MKRHTFYTLGRSGYIQQFFGGPHFFRSFFFQMHVRLPGRCSSGCDAGIGASLKWPTPCRVGGGGPLKKPVDSFLSQ